MDRKEKTILTIILAVSVILRIGAAVYVGNEVEELPGTADQISYHTLALRILDGHGLTFGEPWWPATAPGEQTAHWSYLYTGFLTLVYSLFGPAPLAARLIQAALTGLLHPWLAYLLGRKIFGPVAGLLAAGLTAVYAYFIYYGATLMTEPFYICAILGSLYLALRLAEQGRPDAGQPVRSGWGTAVALGLTLGAAVLLRQLYLLIIPFPFLWILVVGRRRLAPLVLSGLVVVAMILPFTAFNFARFDRFVLLNTNAGFAFFWGNHPVYGTRFQPILPTDTYHELIPPELLTLDEAALDQALLQRGLQFILEDPGRYALLSLSRIPAYFMFWPSAESSGISNWARILSYGLLWPFMLYGVIVALLRRKRSEARQFLRQGLASPVTLLLLFALAYTAIHILTWTLIRYRLPVDAVMLLFAGLAFADLLARVPALRRLIAQVAD